MAKRKAKAPEIRRVLAPTDLSDLGNEAVPYAYAMLPGGGTVYLIHVVETVTIPNPLYAHYSPGRAPTAEERAKQERALAEELRQLVPSDAAQRGIETQVEVVESEQVSEAICAMAERLEVDALCIGTHGRSGLPRVLFGSVTERVMHCTHRPVLLVRLLRD
jgi:nucleotide-binding universal stress UspA family protein